MRAPLIASALTLALAAPAMAQEPIALTYGLNWLPQTEHCGFYQALAGGLYEAAGLAVELVPGGPDINVPALVAGGRYQLGMGSSFTTLNMVAEGIPAKTVAAFFQKDPQTLVAHGGQGIETLEDLKDRPIMIAQFSQQEFWQFLKTQHGFSDEQLRPYTYSAAPFLADPTAVQQGYITEDALLLGAELPEPPVSILLADYGYQNYASTVFGLTEWIDANADVVDAFLAATAEGYDICISGDPAEAKAAILEANPDHGEALFDFKLSQMRERNMVTGEDGLATGQMTEARWASFYETMVASGIYPTGLAVAEAYDLTFIP